MLKTPLFSCIKFQQETETSAVCAEINYISPFFFTLLCLEYFLTQATTMVLGFNFLLQIKKFGIKLEERRKIQILLYSQAFLLSFTLSSTRNSSFSWGPAASLFMAPHLVLYKTAYRVSFSLKRLWKKIDELRSYCIISSSPSSHLRSFVIMMFVKSFSSCTRKRYHFHAKEHPSLGQAAAACKCVIFCYKEI